MHMKGRNEEDKNELYKWTRFQIEEIEGNWNEVFLKRKSVFLLIKMSSAPLGSLQKVHLSI